MGSALISTAPHGAQDAVHLANHVAEAGMDPGNDSLPGLAEVSAASPGAGSVITPARVPLMDEERKQKTTPNALGRPQVLRSTEQPLTSQAHHGLIAE